MEAAGIYTPGEGRVGSGWWGNKDYGECLGQSISDMILLLGTEYPFTTNINVAPEVYILTHMIIPVQNKEDRIARILK